MALTDEDKKRLSKQDQDRIAAATAKWEQADAAGDEAGKKAAADEAAKIRANAGYYTDSYGRYAGEWGEQEEQLFLDGFEGNDSSTQSAQQQAVNSSERTAPPRGYDGMYSVEGGSGKSFIYDPVEKTIEVFRPDGSHDIIKKDNENYEITYRAMEDDTGYDFSKAEPDWELENRRAYWDAKEELDSRKDKEVEEIMAKIDELYLQSQEKEKSAEAKTTTQNRGLYAGYMQEIDPYGEFAEKIAKKGLTKSGYPQYDYAGFKKAFEEQTGDNMQNLRQLKAEIQAALNLALTTQNEKLEETLLNYQENLARLEQEYLRQSKIDAKTVSVLSEAGSAEYNEAEQYGMGGALEDGVHKVLQDYTDENGELVPAGSFIISQNAQEMIIKPDDSQYAMTEAIYNINESGGKSGWKALLDKITEAIDWESVLGTDDQSIIEKVISNVIRVFSGLGKKDFAEGLHLLPDGSYDDAGNPLPDGTYVRVVNGKKYYVTRDDARYSDIVREYYDSKGKAGENTVFYEYDSEIRRYIRYENIDGVIYKDGKAMPESKSKYLPTEIGGSRLPYEENVAGTAGTNRNNTEWYTPEYKSVNAGFGGYQNAGSANGSHIGLDITITGDQMVRNITAGTVTNLNFNTSNGFYVIVQHEIEGIIYYSFYAHMDNGVTNTSKAEQQKLHNICKKEQSGHKLTEEEKQYKDEMFAKVFNVAIGDEIPAGTILGPMGSTGTSTNEHVHIGVYSGRVSGSPYGTYKEPNAEGKNEYRALTEEEKQRGYIDRDGLRFYDVLKVIDSRGQIIAENPFMN